MAKTPAKSDPAYEAAKASYAAVVATVPEAELKGASMPYTSLNGNMFSYLHPSGRLALRLAAADRERFLADHATMLFEAYGVVQKEYVTVPATLLADTAQFAPHFRASYDYATTLKAKPTKKPKKLIRAGDLGAARVFRLDNNQNKLSLQPRGVTPA